MEREKIIELDRAHIKRKSDFPFVMGNAKGCEIFDVNGKRYLDLMAGLYGAVNIGWKQKEVLNAMNAQMKLFNFSPQRVPSEICSKLAKLLTDLTPPELSVCLRAPSGSEAIDLALSSARAASDKKWVIATTNSYHGQTIGALAAGDKKSAKKLVEPLASKISRVRFPYPYRTESLDDCAQECLADIEEKIRKKNNFCAVILEPIQGNGVIVPPNEYMMGLEKICRKNSIFLIFDEVITGFGRTGKLFAFELFKVKPDILVLGKGLSSGYAPIATTMVSKEISEKLGFTVNTTTFGWNPICASAAYASVNFTIKHRLHDRAKELGKYLSKRLSELETNPFVGETRGTGLIWGIELVSNKKTKKPATKLALEVYQKALKDGLYLAISGPHENVLTIMPPLIITKKQLDWGVSRIEKILKEAVQ